MSVSVGTSTVFKEGRNYRYELTDVSFSKGQVVNNLTLYMKSPEAAYVMLRLMDHHFRNKSTDEVNLLVRNVDWMPSFDPTTIKDGEVTASFLQVTPSGLWAADLFKKAVSIAPIEGMERGAEIRLNQEGKDVLPPIPPIPPGGFEEIKDEENPPPLPPWPPDDLNEIVYDEILPPVPGRSDAQMKPLSPNVINFLTKAFLNAAEDSKILAASPDKLSMLSGGIQAFMRKNDLDDEQIKQLNEALDRLKDALNTLENLEESHNLWDEVMKELTEVMQNRGV